MVKLTTLKWEEVEEGQDMGRLEFPLTFTSLVVAVSGTRDLYPIHHDREFAKRAGARDVYVNTMFYQALLGRFVTDWAGPESFIRKLGFTMKANNCPGDTITVRGTVAKKYSANGQKLVDLDLHIDNQLGADTTTSTITLELP